MRSGSLSVSSHIKTKDMLVNIWLTSMLGQKKKKRHFSTCMRQAALSTPITELLMRPFLQLPFLVSQKQTNKLIWLNKQNKQNKNLSRNRNEFMLGTCDILSSSRASPCVTWCNRKDHPTSSIGWKVIMKVPMGKLALFGKMLPSLDPLSNKTWPTMFPKELWGNLTYFLSSWEQKKKKKPQNSQSNYIFGSYIGK